MWFTETGSEMCKLVSFERNLFRINVSYDKET
uniref:Cytoplasmic protein n=1 Tax=Strongyloides stercoralis TaxID=6248 RepID=A0A0K0E7K7_STRER